jgi:PAS domain S-box-containing protein
LIGIITDITERKKTEQALREAEAFNQAVITNSPIGISVRNRAGVLLSANEAWKDIWGIQDEEFQGLLQEKFTELQFDERDENLKPYQDQVRWVYEQGGSLNLPDLKTRYYRPGTAEWVSQYYYAILDEKGKVNRVVTLTEDISARKKAEAEIIKSQALLERVQEVAHMGSWEIELDTRMVTASDEACRIYGMKIGTLTLANVQVIPLEEFRPTLDAALTALIKGEAEYNLEFRIQRISDSAIRDIHSVAEYNRENNTVIGSIQDITERKAAERELKEQLDLLERMNNVMVDRELRMLEIKKEVNALLAKAGEKEKYRIFDL